MKIITISFLSLSFLFYNISNLISQPSLTWEKLYGYPHSDEGTYDICESTDGNFFAAGSSGNTFSNSRIYVLKLNQFGDTIWSRKYDAGHYGYAVTSTNDCGCVITGYGIDSLYVLKLNCDGNIVWQKFYPTGAICFDIQRVTDGGFIACGYNLFKGYFMKIDSIGNLKWVHNYIAENQMGFASCIEAIDGGYIAGGYVKDPDTSKIELIKVDTEGTKIWERRFKILNNGAVLTSIAKLKDKYIIFGNSNSIFFEKLNLNGFQEFTYVFNDKGTEGLRAAQIINENKFVFSSQIFPQTGDTMYIRNWISDSSGNILKEKIFKTEGYMDLQSVLPIENTDVLFAGIFKPIPGSNDDNSYFVRSDSNLYSKPLNIKIVNTKIPSEFKLYQNFPNPFNPDTKIKFDLIKTGFVVINIYNVNGKLILTLINKKLLTGNYEVDFISTDVSKSLSSGIYFYELIFNNNISTAKKMILIK